MTSFMVVKIKYLYSKVVSNDPEGQCVAFPFKRVSITADECTAQPTWKLHFIISSQSTVPFTATTLGVEKKEDDVHYHPLNASNVKCPLEIFPVKIIILIVLLKKDDSFTSQATQLSFT